MCRLFEGGESGGMSLKIREEAYRQKSEFKMWRQLTV